LGQEDHDGDGNSSSGVSSDGGHEGQGGNPNYVTCVPINPDSDSSEDSSDKTWILKEENGDSLPLPPPPPAAAAAAAVKRTNTNPEPETNNHNNNVNLFHVSKNNTTTQQQQQESSNYGTLGRAPPTRPISTGGNLTKNAVSLVKLPPPIELESETEDRSPRATPILKKPINSTPANTNTTSTSPMYHTLQPQRSKSMLQEQQQALAARQYQYQGQVQGPTRQAEKSIEESIKLIRMHVEALKVSPISSIY
jgi:hypothetical protein